MQIEHSKVDCSIQTVLLMYTKIYLNFKVYTENGGEQELIKLINKCDNCIMAHWQLK